VDTFAVIQDLLKGLDETGLNLPGDVMLAEESHA
jgi:hypothetical protein